MVAKNLLLGIATMTALTVIVTLVMTVQPVLAPRDCGACNDIAKGHGEDVSSVAGIPPYRYIWERAEGHGEDVSDVATAPR